MLVEEGLIARMTRPEAATGPLVANQVYPDHLPDDATLPAIVYERKPDPEGYDYTVFGELENIRATWKFHCYAAQDEKAAALRAAKAIATDLNRYSVASDDTLTIHYCYAVDQYDNFDGITMRHRVTVEIEVLYTDKTP